MLDPRRRRARRRGQRQRLVAAILVATASTASVAHALSEHPKPRLRCAAQPAACTAAIAWQRDQRRELTGEVRRLRDHLRRVHAPTVREAALLAGQAFHISGEGLFRVAGCETGHTWDPFAYNRRSGATGAWQFLASTWSHTPFAAWPRTNPFAQALATAQIVVADRGYGQWDCGWAAR